MNGNYFINNEIRKLAKVFFADQPSLKKIIFCNLLPGCDREASFCKAIIIIISKKDDNLKSEIEAITDFNQAEILQRANNLRHKVKDCTAVKTFLHNHVGNPKNDDSFLIEKINKSAYCMHVYEARDNDFCLN